MSSYSPAVGRDMHILAYGHYGAPMIAFPSGGGRFHDFEDNSMLHAAASFIEAGKLKLYCCESLDSESWLNHGIEPRFRAVRHAAYEDYVLKDLVPWVRHDCKSVGLRIAVTGCSIGAYHAANFALKHAHVFHYALCMSGRYDLDAMMGAQSDHEDVYFNNPLAYVHHLHGDALEHVRRNTHLTLVCGQGAWEDKCLMDTRRLANLLAQKGISHEIDIWGKDVEHHWYWWQRQFAHHLGRAL